MGMGSVVCYDGIFLKVLVWEVDCVVTQVAWRDVTHAGNRLSLSVPCVDVDTFVVWRVCT